MHLKGYTLIEVLIILAIISTLLVLSTPFTRSFIIKNRSLAYVNHLVVALNYARTEAIKQNAMVIFCGSTDFKTCDGAWSKGQILKMQDRILHTFESVPEGDHLEWRSSFSKNHQLTFTSIGFTNGQQGSFYYYPKGHAEFSHRVVVTHKGLVRVE